MSLSDTYASLTEMRARFEIDDVGGIDDTQDDESMTRALEAATAWINEYTNRNFNDSGAVSARVFRPTSCGLCFVDDFHTTDGLIITVDDTEWTSDQYQLEPLNGVVNGTPGWPYTRLVSLDSEFTVSSKATVSVTARWGWAAVPKPIKEACLIAASEIFKLKDSPFGISGSDEYGVVRIGKHSPRVMALVNLYKKKALKLND